jgi:hypothetical protein
MAGHVLALTMLANLGAMVPALCSRREHKALAVGMRPRGEVGAGVLLVCLGYGLGGPVITAAIRWRKRTWWRNPSPAGCAAFPGAG